MSLYVTVELRPGGDKSRARTLASVEIGNVSELAEVSDYVIEAVTDPGTVLQRITREKVFGHRRRDGWVPLVCRVLRLLQAPTPVRGEGEGGKTR